MFEVLSTKTQTSSSTSAITLEAELSKLSREKAESLGRAKRLSQEHDRAWKQEIGILARILEREYTLLGQQWLIKSISQDISRLYYEQDIVIWGHIDRYLDAKYYNEKQQQSSIGFSPTGEQEIVKNTLTMLQQLSRNVGDIARESLPELIDFADKFSKAGRKRSALEHIPLTPGDNSSFIDQIHDSKEAERSHVTIDRPIPHGSLMFDAIARKIVRWQSVQQRVFEFPPEILEKDEEYADALDASDVWMDPILDLKYSKCLPDWLKAESYRDIYGKHAAGVMSYSVTNLCKNCTNEKTKEWVRMEAKYSISHSIYECLNCGFTLDTKCKSCQLPMRESQKAHIGWVCPECEGTEALHRNLTREQIGDKSSIIMDIAEKFLMRIPDAAAFCNWYRDWLEERVSGRKSRLSNDLSERA